MRVTETGQIGQTDLIVRSILNRIALIITIHAAVVAVAIWGRVYLGLRTW